jgi:hypothetical protein
MGGEVLDRLPKVGLPIPSDFGEGFPMPIFGTPDELATEEEEAEVEGIESVDEESCTKNLRM